VSGPDFSTAPRRRPPARDLLLAAAALVLTLLSVRAAIGAHTERERARSRLAEVQADIEASKARLRVLEGRGGGNDGPLGQAVLTSEVPFPWLLAEIAELLPPDVRLERIGLEYGRDLSLEMNVVARDPRAFDHLLERLDAFPKLRDVRPGPENREGEVRTTVRAVWRTRP
jgi:hypothetical protein